MLEFSLTDSLTEYAFTHTQASHSKEDHWIELLQGKLKLPREVTKENVKVEHFLSKIDILIEPSTLPFVKNLQSRALGEVQIREALQELKTWERSAELKLLTTEESGRKIPLIKEWKVSRVYSLWSELLSTGYIDDLKFVYFHIHSLHITRLIATLTLYVPTCLPFYLFRT